MKWKGLNTYAKQFLYGGVGTPIVKRVGASDTPTSNTNYESMHPNYRWFRQDEIVRKCLITNAFFATMTADYYFPGAGPVFQRKFGL